MVEPLLAVFFTVRYVVDVNVVDVIVISLSCVDKAKSLLHV